MTLRPTALLSFALIASLCGCGLPDEADDADGGAPATTQPPPNARLPYRVTQVRGTYGGGAQMAMAPTWVDTTADVRCRFESQGTVSTQAPFLGEPVHDTWSKGITVHGRSACPSAAGTSTKGKPCEGGANDQEALFAWTLALTGYDDASEVVLRAHPPTALPFSCNFAAVTGEQTTPWGMEARTTVGAFRAGKPFEVRFVGSNTLEHDRNTSSVGWDLTLTIAPQ